MHVNGGSLSHPTIKDGWFREISEDWPGQALALKVKEILHVEDSKYQNILVFKSTDYGNVLVLDGVIQVTERDEFAYQEMITHLGLNSHAEPKRVLIIGGGDGGVLREVVKHRGVQEVEMVEIDQSVIDVSKKYLKDMASCFNHPKIKVFVEDGFEYIKRFKNHYDVIITDSSDPEGPAEQLFHDKFFKLVHEALTENGIVVTQGSENIWLNLNLIKQLKAACKRVFPVVEYASTCVPTYTSGQLGLIVCGKNPKINVRIPVRVWDRQEESTINRYYNREIHTASFVLPTWARHILNDDN